MRIELLTFGKKDETKVFKLHTTVTILLQNKGISYQ